MWRSASGGGWGGQSQGGSDVWLWGQRANLSCHPIVLHIVPYIFTHPIPQVGARVGGGPGAAPTFHTLSHISTLTPHFPPQVGAGVGGGPGASPE